MRQLIGMFVVCVMCLGAATIDAEVVRVEISSRTPYASGRSFGERGPYELVRGVVHFSVDPFAQSSRNVVDLDLAPRDGDGRVRFSADFGLLKPVEVERSNGAVFYDVNNRGNPTCLGIIGGGADHFFARHGFVVAWSGWIAELIPDGRRYVLRAPVARDSGEAITGVVRAEMAPDRDTDRLSIAHWGGHGSYAPTERGQREATLTRRLREKDPRVPIPRSQWYFDIEWVDGAALPRVDLVYAGGFRAGEIYELIYEAKNPLVQGLGLAGIRDWISSLKYFTDERNPLLKSDGAPAMEFAYGFGTSQSGRCLRMLLYDGFNRDESGRMVFDGVIPHVAGAGLGFFNHRFASPTRHNAQHDNHLYPADVFPFTYGDDVDPFTGRVDGILRRARATGTVPKVFHTQSSSEYWHRSGSLVHTDPLGQRDAQIPPEVRIYSFGGTQHGPGSGRPSGPSTRGQLPSNHADYRPFMRALVLALDAWVRDGVAPPPSAYPKISDGTLVGWRERESGWPALPGVRYPQVIQQPEFLDRGPEFLRSRRTSIEPPRSLGDYVVKVGAYRADGNELGFLNLPSVDVPLGTFTSWNLRHRSIGAETELLSLSGGYIPFARSRAERTSRGDPRPSLGERYASFKDYREQFRESAKKLVDERYWLPEDLDRIGRILESVRTRFE